MNCLCIPHELTGPTTSYPAFFCASLSSPPRHLEPASFLRILATPSGGGMLDIYIYIYISILETLRSLGSRMFLARCARAIALELCWDQGGLSRSWFEATLAYVGPCWTKGRLRWLQTLIPTQFWLSRGEGGLVKISGFGLSVYMLIYK